MILFLLSLIAVNGFVPVTMRSGATHLVDSRMYALMEQEMADDCVRRNVFPVHTHGGESVEGVSLKLGPLVASTASSTVWTVKGNCKLLVKYHLSSGASEDPDLADFHPLSREYYMMKSIEHLGISLKVYFLSFATELPPVRFQCLPKFAFRMTQAAWERNRASPVRFMVMERGVDSADHKVPTNIGEAANVFAEMITLLRILHDQGNMVHGDAHSGNFVFDDQKKLKLIDFSRARFVQLPTYPFPTHLLRKHAMFSPWEMQGFIGARRDDVFRVVLVFARAISCGVQLFSWYDSMHWVHEFEAKANLNLFAHSQYADSLAPISRLAQSMTHVDMRPPYEEILQCLQPILQSSLELCLK